MSDKPTIEVSARAKAETPAAILVEIDDAEFWLPITQLESWCVEELTESRRTEDFVTIEIPEWLAEKEGLI